MAKNETAAAMRQRWLDLLARMPPLHKRTDAQQTQIDLLDRDCVRLERNERNKADARKWIEQKRYQKVNAYPGEKVAL